MIKGAHGHDYSDEYPTQWQSVLIGMLISDPAAWNVCREHFLPQYFDDGLRAAVNFIRSYDVDYHRLPTTEQIIAKTAVAIERFSEPQDHTDATVSEFSKFVRYRAIENAIFDGVPLLGQGRFDEIIKNTQAAYDLTVGAAESEFGGIWLDECATIEPPSYLIAPWLVKDTVTCVYGAPGSFKSFYCLEAAFRLATGTPFAGRAVEQTSVAYVAAEGQAGIAMRLEALRERHGLTGHRNSVRLITRPINLLDDEEIKRFIQHLMMLERTEGIDFGLVVIDTYSQCIAGAEENSQGVASKASANMIRIRRELRTTVLYVHHTGKDEGRGMRGSDALRANTDGAVLIDREENTLDAVAILKRVKDAPLLGKIRFSMSMQKIARLANQEIDGSLVAEFVPEELIIAANAPGRPYTVLGHLLQQMVAGQTLSVARALKTVCQHVNPHYKEKLAEQLPFDREVDVIDEARHLSGTLIRRLKAGDKWGEITCLSKFSEERGNKEQGNNP